MNYWNGKIPWIQSSDIQKDTLFGVIPQKFISEEGLQNSSAKLIPQNSIAIVTRVGVGKLAIIEQNYTTSQDFLSLSNLNGDIFFLVYSLFRMLQKESALQKKTCFLRKYVFQNRWKNNPPLAIFSAPSTTFWPATKTI